MTDFTEHRLRVTKAEEAFLASAQNLDLCVHQRNAATSLREREVAIQAMRTAVLTEQTKLEELREARAFLAARLDRDKPLFFQGDPRLDRLLDAQEK
jgi:hypothetical protein